ncbi:hypothetical protein [Flavobacterium sp.]|jgi:hypothetical protein|uniref:hypothetical protein n=1 Tax=Flavobacterium sp. TaxID=239 RepID=UPI0037BE96F6
MKRLLLIFLIFTVISVDAQDCDIIILNDGTEVPSIIEELRINEIAYKKCDNLNGPLYVIEKISVFMLKYKNGQTFIMREGDLTNSKSNQKKFYLSKLNNEELKTLVEKEEWLKLVEKSGSSRTCKIVAFKKIQTIYRPCDGGLGFGINNIYIEKLEGESFVLYLDNKE